MKLFEYLVDKFGYDEPIILDDLKKDIDFITYENLRKSMKRMTDAGLIVRYQPGLYFIPKPNSLIKSNSISLHKIIDRKYLTKKNGRVGYITGLAFANSLRLTTQNAVNIEVVTSETTSIKRNVDLKKATVTLRKPKVAITDDNYKLLQVLDLLNSFDRYSEVDLLKSRGKISNYLKGTKMSRRELNGYLKKYPKKTTENLLESELYDEITQ